MENVTDIDTRGRNEHTPVLDGSNASGMTLIPCSTSVDSEDEFGQFEHCEGVSIPIPVPLLVPISVSMPVINDDGSTKLLDDTEHMADLDTAGRHEHAPVFVRSIICDSFNPCSTSVKIEDDFGPFEHCEGVPVSMPVCLNPVPVSASEPMIDIDASTKPLADMDHVENIDTRACHEYAPVLDGSNTSVTTLIPCSTSVDSEDEFGQFEHYGGVPVALSQPVSNSVFVDEFGSSTQPHTLINGIDAMVRKEDALDGCSTDSPFIIECDSVSNPVDYTIHPSSSNMMDDDMFSDFVSA
jgi:hypothetical protein